MGAFGIEGEVVLIDNNNNDDDDDDDDGRVISPCCTGVEEMAKGCPPPVVIRIDHLYGAL